MQNYIIIADRGDLWMFSPCWCVRFSCWRGYSNWCIFLRRTINSEDETLYGELFRRYWL